jgi:glycosyltransferase involved in cell wall biosynthesis
MSHKFTVVIPTRDRANTLKFSIKSVLRQDYDNLTVIVSDNASEDETREVVASFNDPRLKYVNPGNRVSMARHFEFALAHVCDGYVISIGDDDGLAVDAIRSANEIVESEGTLAITSSRAQYDWEGMQNNRDNQLIFPLKTGIERRSSSKYLDRVLNGNLAYQEIPIAYHGFIAASELEKLRRAQGRLFLSNQLDMFSALALAHLIPEYVHSWSPLVINGTSNRSNGASHFGQTKNTTEKIYWDKENDLQPLPPFEFIPSIKVLLAEAYMQLQKSNTVQPIVTFRLSGMLTQAYAEQLNLAQPLVAEKIASIAAHWRISLTRSSPTVTFQRIALLLARLYRLCQLSVWKTSGLVDCKKFGIHDVAEAAQLMHYLLVLRQESRLPSRVNLVLNRLGITGSVSAKP